MKLSIGACLGALIALILGTTPPTHGAADDHLSLKPSKTYEYSATFTARVDYALKVVYDDKGNDDTVSLGANIAGSLSRVRLSQAKMAPVDLSSAGARGRVRVTSGEAWAQERTDDAQSVTTCEGETAKVVGKPSIKPAIFSEFMPYAGLAFPTECVNNQGGARPGLFTLPSIFADFTRATAKAGAKRLSIPFDTEWTTSVGPEACPGNDGAAGTTCSYKVRGVLKLTRTDKDPEEGGSRAVEVSPGATKVETEVICPAKCTIILELTPLKGGPSIEVERISPKPRKPVTVTVDIPRSKRALVLESGGVTVEITYKLAGGTSFTDIRAGRV
jgi:hypothetical protein